MDFSSLRHSMVRQQLRGRGIADERVLAVMSEAPRHLFVPERQRKRAYDDEPLPIGMGQTISQPYMVARMTELLALTGSETVLEVGTGSGYQAAVLARLAGRVWTIERHPALATDAERLLGSLGMENVRVVIGDGTLGLPEAAPFDAIVVTAAAPGIPPALREQLRPGGRMVIPTASSVRGQDLLLIEKVPLEPLPPAGADTREGGGLPGQTGWMGQTGRPSSEPVPCRFRETSILGCIFVPLIGKQGYPA
jgi:protein-L-isoaspartate(D-aspartate) O-methyltransferase